MIELTTAILSKVVTPRPQNSHKGTFGRIVLIGGNEQFGGAILMSAQATVYSGAGLTTVVTAPKNHSALHARLPEAMVVDWTDSQAVQKVTSAADVLLIGPGMGTDTFSKQLLSTVLHQQTAKQLLIIDGSAITLFAQTPLALNYPKHTVFTPHQMEWQRLSGLAIPDQSEQKNRLQQQKLEATVVLKSHRTEIYGQNGTYRNTVGSAAMATGGMGDTLAGLLAGFCGQFAPTDETIGAAVYLHSYIGDQLAKEQYVVLPTQISEQLPYWMHRFSEQEILY